MIPDHEEGTATIPEKLPVVFSPSFFPFLPESTSNSMDNDRGQRATWVRLVDLCGEAKVSQTTGLRWVRGLPAGKAEKRPRESGGRAEWWVQTDAAEEFLQDYASIPQASGKRPASGASVPQASEDQTAAGEPASVTNVRQTAEDQAPKGKPASVTNVRQTAEDQASAGEPASVTADRQVLEHGFELQGEQASDPDLVLVDLETRLARVEGALAGRRISELSEQLEELAAAYEGLQQELTTARAEAGRREEALSAQLAAIRETVDQEKEAWRETLDSLYWELTPHREASDQQVEKARHQMAKLVAERKEAERKLGALAGTMQQREAQFSAQMAVIQEALARPWWKRWWPWGNRAPAWIEPAKGKEQPADGPEEKPADPSEEPPAAPTSTE